MAFLSHGESVGDDAFKAHLTPMSMATAVQNALSALWFTMTPEYRSSDELELAALHTFQIVERWWMDLEDRSGLSFVSAVQSSFGPSESSRVEARTGLPDLATMMAAAPSRCFAEALFWTWLQLPETTRTPEQCIELVRAILCRELRSAAVDVAAFEGPAD